MNPVTTYVALGSNLKQPQQQLNTACKSLSKLRGIELIRVSPFYRSKAIGPENQPDYINAVAKLGCNLKPVELLAQLQTLELEQGRVRTERWAPRTLDLDILLFGDQLIDTADLQVPHPRMHQRNFVLYPLFDLAPTLVLPKGVAIGSLLARVGDEGLERITLETRTDQST